VKVWKKILVTAVGRNSSYFRMRTQKVVDHYRHSIVSITHRQWNNEVGHDHLKHSNAKAAADATRFIEGDSYSLEHEERRLESGAAGRCPF